MFHLATISFVLLCQFYYVITAPVRKNIVFIWFDDLAFGDVGHYGASSPTPILDTLMTDKAVRLNFHYSDTQCTPSRSAFFTGRYSWLSGINSITRVNSQYHYDSSLTLWSEILAKKNYKGFFAGKWHIGYNLESDLPHKRGFSSGLVSHTGTQYYCREFTHLFNAIDSRFEEPSKAIQNRRDTAFDCSNRDCELKIHDLYRITQDSNGNPMEENAYVLNEDYSEKLYMTEIETFLKGLDSANDNFFLYYALRTPHKNFVDPPTVRPDGVTAIDYSKCNNHVPALSTERLKFCKQVHYASLNIEDIISGLKANNLYDDTLIIITSDNGAGIQDGENLPFRGAKSGSHDGALRTPTILKGGVIDSLLSSYGITECEYNKLVHISDWYHIIMDVTNSKNNANYQPDSDHSSLQIWDDIQCECNPSCSTSTHPSRTESIMMRKCNNVDIIYSAYVIKDGWKLVVNGSNDVNDDCPNIDNVKGINPFSSYNLFNGDSFTTPNKTYYDEIYVPRIASHTNAKNYFGSKCLEALAAESGLTNINNENYYKFEYKDLMLFKIDEDHIEACNVAKDYPGKVQELVQYLRTRSLEYNVPYRNKTELNIVSLREEFESYDCNVAYTKPWNDKSGGVTDIEGVWRKLINLKNNCPVSPPQSILSSYYYNTLNLNDNVFIKILIILIVSMVLSITIINNYYHYKRKREYIVIP